MSNSKNFLMVSDNQWRLTRQYASASSYAADHEGTTYSAIWAARWSVRSYPLPNEFVPPAFTVPTSVVFGELRLEPLGPEHNAGDYAAWTSSIDHIRATPGFPWGSWPVSMTSAANLRDLERHADDFRLRRGFTYTVLDAAGKVVGCVYIYPSQKEDVDAQVRSWVSAERSETDLPLEEAVREWLRTDWPFRRVEYRQQTSE